MPELPEVQTIVNDLNKKVIGRRIKSAWSDWPKLVKKPKWEIFKQQIKGAKILNARRVGKNILIDLDNNRLLLIHQKMTGHLLVGRWKINGVAKPLEPKPVVIDPQNRFIHLILELDNGKMLALSDLRKFAKVMFGLKSEIENPQNLPKGIDPLSSDFTLEKLKSIFVKEKRKIKQVLMDQDLIVGIGNIYSDEILFEAKINPFRASNSLSANEIKKIYQAILKILKKAIKLRGTSTSDFRDTEGRRGLFDKVLKVYRQEGEKCPTGNGVIVRKKIGGRSAHFCPTCQK